MGPEFWELPIYLYIHSLIPYEPPVCSILFGDTMVPIIDPPFGVQSFI